MTMASNYSIGVQKVWVDTVHMLVMKVGLIKELGMSVIMMKELSVKMNISELPLSSAISLWRPWRNPLILSTCLIRIKYWKAKSRDSKANQKDWAHLWPHIWMNRADLTRKGKNTFWKQLWTVIFCSRRHVRSVLVWWLFQICYFSETVTSLHQPTPANECPIRVQHRQSGVFHPYRIAPPKQGGPNEFAYPVTLDPITQEPNYPSSSMLNEAQEDEHVGIKQEKPDYSSDSDRASSTSTILSCQTATDQSQIAQILEVRLAAF